MWGFWILILLLIVLILAIPTWPYSRTWGYWPGGIVLAILLIWLVFVWLGWIAFAWPWGAPPAPPPA